MEINRKWLAISILILFIPVVSSALEVDINGKQLTPEIQGNPCIDITGEYTGFNIVPSEIGKTPQICFNNNRQNHLEIHHATLVSTGAASENAIVINFTHEFPPGPNGLVTARTHLYGFFSTPTGVGVPVGASVKLSSYFSQNNNLDLITEPFEHTVGEAIESGVFSFGEKKKYLVSGARSLKGALMVSFAGLGDKLTIPLATGVKVDLGSQFEDRLDSLSESESSSASATPEAAPQDGTVPGN